MTKIPDSRLVTAMEAIDFAADGWKGIAPLMIAPPSYQNIREREGLVFLMNHGLRLCFNEEGDELKITLNMAMAITSQQLPATTFPWRFDMADVKAAVALGVSQHRDGPVAIMTDHTSKGMKVTGMRHEGVQVKVYGLPWDDQ